MRLSHLLSLAYLAIVQVGLYNVSGVTWGRRHRKGNASIDHFPLMEKGNKGLVDATNVSAICGLPFLTKGGRKHVVAGKKYKMTAKLTNNVNVVFEDIVVQISLPRGATYRKARVFPKLDYGNEPALEQQDTLVVWRHVHMKPKQSRYFRVFVDIACNTSTPLTFRFYTTVGGFGWITGPDVQVGRS
jgi:hypothetical protein